MLHIIFVVILIFFVEVPVVYGDDVDTYYQSIDPTARDDVLKAQLHDLINPHDVLSYDDIWTAFKSVDKFLPGYPCNENLTFIPDVYSAYCWEPEKLTTGGECGNYKKEGDCYNREHLWPKSWFGGFDNGENAQTDLFELWPSDGYVNGLRGDLPLGDVIVSSISYNSTNKSLIGKCVEDSNSKCFEPSSVFKGDFARSYFYLATAYWNEWSCCDTEGVNGSDIKTWMENSLRVWHLNDPVDDNERARNNEIYSNWQHNRNPFIDHPEWVDQISNF